MQECSHQLRYSGCFFMISQLSPDLCPQPGEEQNLQGKVEHVFWFCRPEADLQAILWQY